MSKTLFVTEPKSVLEVLPYVFNFRDLLLPGDSILGTEIVVTVTVLSGIDNSPSLMLFGLPNVSGNKITQNIQAGVPGVIYELTLSSNTVNGYIVEKTTRISVYPLPDNVTPTFTPTFLTSHHYPYWYEEAYKAGIPTFLGGVLVPANFIYTCPPEQYRSGIPLLTGGTFILGLVTYGNYIPEQYQSLVPTFIGGTLTIGNFVYSNYIPEQYRTSIAWTGGTLTIGNVVYGDYVPEQYQSLIPTFVGGTLVL